MSLTETIDRLARMRNGIPASPLEHDREDRDALAVAIEVLRRLEASRRPLNVPEKIAGRPLQGTGV